MMPVPTHFPRMIANGGTAYLGNTVARRGIAAPRADAKDDEHPANMKRQGEFTRSLESAGVLGGAEASS